MIKRSVVFREHAKDVQSACITHPFVMGIADGTLPPSVFSRWVIQDWKYLLTYMKVLERIADDDHEILAVYTQPDRTSGRGRKTVVSPMKEYSLSKNYRVLQPENFRV